MLKPRGCVDATRFRGGRAPSAGLEDTPSTNAAGKQESGGEMKGARLVPPITVWGSASGEAEIPPFSRPEFQTRSFSPKRSFARIIANINLHMLLERGRSRDLHLQPFSDTGVLAVGLEIYLVQLFPCKTIAIS